MSSTQRRNPARRCWSRQTNLRDGFAAFGVVERFDETFLLVMRRLGLEETTYTGRRISNRLRGDEVPADVMRQAEEINRFDIELYGMGLGTIRTHR